MLYKNTLTIFYTALLGMGLLLLSSCLPQQNASRLKSEEDTTSPQDPNGHVYGDPSFSRDEIFIQEGATQSFSSFSLAVNFSDSFLIRGKALSTYLRNIPNTTKFCLVGKYTHSVGNDKFLILAAKAKSYTDLINKTTEFYLQVEPSLDQSNQNDCLTNSLTNTLFTGASSPSAYYSFTQLCSTCNSSVTSEGLRLYLNNGEALPALNLARISLTISGTSSGTENSCVESSACRARGYSCCLEGQCVRDGAVRPGAMMQSGFSSAQADVASNSTRFVLYPQFYFVCSSRPDSNGTPTNNDPVDADYDARIRLLELSQLYQCLNRVDGEFSYCSVKFTSASQKINASLPFSSSEKGHVDDINFSTLNSNFATGDYVQNIVKVVYAGQVLYEASRTPLNPLDGVFSTSGNDDIISAQSILITKSLPANAQDDNLYLTYKIDGTCEKLGANLAKCTKTYIQNSSNTTSTYYHDNSKVYLLPSYADTSSSSNINVKISGMTVPEDATTWSKAQNPNRIIFSSSYPIYQNQSVEITYYVTSNVSTLLSSRINAQAAINTICVCGETGKCNLRPLLNSQNAITNYECVYPEPTITLPPANQTVFVSNKNIPHRYYDLNGVNYDENYSNALPQEGTSFSYRDNNSLKPTNLDIYNGYTGFNEIYGSFSSSAVGAAKPAKMVKVKKDKIYDIFTNSGVFSTCLTCGSDYYSTLQKIFPQNLNSVGGGYAPDNYTSKRMGNTGLYRGDDLLYGRACFVPATMIPWTHKEMTSATEQRRQRLAGQHFLFANGYNRDWYGLDYGSLIGSFDGVTWFSIGNQRRIKAISNHLYLAVNAYFGDLNLDSNYSVSISETTPFSPAMPDHDSKTTGGECQKSHYCSTDNDCFAQLGYDYTCQNITGITTSWPVFDANGLEVVGQVSKSLASIVGGTNGQSKRCVYRGRGAPCHLNLNSTNSTFNSTTLPGLLSCSTNNMCRNLTATTPPLFNNRISRFANTPVAQNSAHPSLSPSDIVGLGARILGRPFNFYGTETVPNLAGYSSAASLNVNNVFGICIPGKNISSSTRTYDLNSSVPTSQIDNADKILGIGSTLSSQNTKILNSCPATDNIGVSIQHYDLPLGDPDTINLLTTTQNLSTNLLNITELTDQNIFSSSNNSQILSVGLQKNACLRAPGSSCFSDLDCAPSEFIGNKVRSTDLTGILNEAEINYWKEDLVCGNPDFKYLSAGVLNTATFNVKNNTCCREYGKDFTVYTQIDSSSPHWWCNGSNVHVAGINTSLTSFNRYSRVHSAFDKMTCATPTSTKSYALSLVAPDLVTKNNQRFTQFKTLDTVNSRTCCTKNWIRNFSTTNGGGHRWGREKMQNIDKANFKTLNWNPNDATDSDNPVPYECTSSYYNSPSCEMKNFSDFEKNLYLKFFGSLELVGIPQVAIMNEDQVYKLNNGINGGVPNPIIQPVDGTTVLGAPEDFRTFDSKKLYSASNSSAFSSSIKTVFSDKDFSCCIPSGQQVPDYTTSSQCCTGYLGNTGASNLLRCCLPDFTDLTVYLNRYVSSEGRGLPDISYDPDTGYIKDPGLVELMAAQKNLCCSGKMARGVAIRKLPIPLTSDQWLNTESAWTRRFVYLNSNVDNNSTFGPIGDLFDTGIRWNDHVYCIPSGLNIPDEK